MQNLAVHSIENKAHVIEGDIRQNILKFKKDKFDIFFFDPPFADTNYIEIIKIIKEKKFFNKNHILIIHREKNSNEDLKLFLKILIEKNYGRSKIIFGKFN